METPAKRVLILGGGFGGLYTALGSACYNRTATLMRWRGHPWRQVYRFRAAT